MISIEVTFPALKRVYEFTVSEDEKISILKEELIDIIAQTERIDYPKDKDNFVLCCVDNESMLSPDASLRDYGVHNGDRFILL